LICRRDEFEFHAHFILHSECSQQHAERREAECGLAHGERSAGAQAARSDVDRERHRERRLVARDLDREAGLERAVSHRHGQAAHRDGGKLRRVEQRRTQHIAQGAGLRVFRSLLGKIRALLAAQRGVIDHEAGGGNAQGERRGGGGPGIPHPSAERAVDDDVIVPELRHRPGPIDQNAQFGLRRIDAIQSAGRGRLDRAGRTLRRGSPGRRRAARGQQDKRENDCAAASEHDSRSALLLD